MVLFNMKLSDWAKKEGIHYQTAWKWYHKGLIPNAVQIETGTILVLESKEEAVKFKEAK